MHYLSNRYVPVYNHKGIDICVLKIAVPANGDERGYRVDCGSLKDMLFNDIADAVGAINDHLAPGAAAPK